MRWLGVDHLLTMATQKGSHQTLTPTRKKNNTHTRSPHDHHPHLDVQHSDHRKLGQDLDLFSISESVGGGLVFWHPKGAMIRHILEAFWKDVHLKRGYQLLYSPHIAKVCLLRVLLRLLV